LAKSGSIRKRRKAERKTVEGKSSACRWVPAKPGAPILLDVFGLA
jgi:hypothetical protein